MKARIYKTSIIAAGHSPTNACRDHIHPPVRGQHGYPAAHRETSTDEEREPGMMWRYLDVDKEGRECWRIAATMRHRWARHLVSDLETNPHTQYKVHLYGVIYWLINFPAVCYLFFGQPNLWTKLGIFITLIYSIYANFATDYGAMSAAMAAFGDKPLPEIPLQAEHDD